MSRVGPLATGCGLRSEFRTLRFLAEVQSPKSVARYDLYRATRTFPVEERYGLQSQLRRGAVSVAANLVEGSARPTKRDYLHFIAIALGSASEVRYLVELAVRLGFVDAGGGTDLARRYDRVVRALQGLVTALTEVRSP